MKTITVKHPNGQIKTKYNIDQKGKLQGLWIEWKENGLCSKTTYYLDDKPVQKEQYRKYLITQIRTQYCHITQTTIEEIRKKNKAKKITDIRALYAYILRQSNYTLHQIAKEIHRTHPTAHHLTQRTDNLINTKDKEIIELYNQTKHLIAKHS